MRAVTFITGASGVGKSTMLAGLAKKYADKDRVFLHFDSIGIPSLEQMNAEYGSPSAWQKAKTYEWIDTLISKYNNKKVFFEGQVNLEFIQKGFRKHDFTDYQIILVDCNEAEMARRLNQRGQPELFTEDMKNWLKFLRRQGDALPIPVIDTSARSEEESLQALESLIR